MPRPATQINEEGRIVDLENQFAHLNADVKVLQDSMLQIKDKMDLLDQNLAGKMAALLEKQQEQLLDRMIKHQEKLQAATIEPRHGLYPRPADRLFAGSSNSNTPPTTNLYRTPKLDLPSFDGTQVRTWIQKTNRYFHLNPMTDHQKTLIASLHFNGRAELWFQTDSTRFETMQWSEFQDRVLLRFDDEVADSVIGEFKRLTQTGSLRPIGNEIPMEEGSEEIHVDNYVANIDAMCDMEFDLVDESTLDNPDGGTAVVSECLEVVVEPHISNISVNVFSQQPIQSCAGINLESPVEVVLLAVVRDAEPVMLMPKEPKVHPPDLATTLVTSSLFSQIIHKGAGSVSISDAYIKVARMVAVVLESEVCRDVYASFDKYVEVERMEGDNQYHAEQHGLQDAKKGVTFVNFPPVLQLQLKRFEYDCTEDEIHSRRFPKESTVCDVLNGLKTKVELSHPNAELRLFGMHGRLANRAAAVTHSVWVRDVSTSVASLITAVRHFFLVESVGTALIPCGMIASMCFDPGITCPSSDITTSITNTVLQFRLLLGCPTEFSGLRNLNSDFSSTVVDCQHLRYLIVNYMRKFGVPYGGFLSAARVFFTMGNNAVGRWCFCPRVNNQHGLSVQILYVQICSMDGGGSNDSGNGSLGDAAAVKFEECCMQTCQVVTSLYSSLIFVYIGGLSATKSITLSASDGVLEVSAVCRLILILILVGSILYNVGVLTFKDKHMAIQGDDDLTRELYSWWMGQKNRQAAQNICEGLSKQLVHQGYVLGVLFLCALHPVGIAAVKAMFNVQSILGFAVALLPSPGTIFTRDMVDTSVISYGLHKSVLTAVPLVVGHSSFLWEPGPFLFLVRCQTGQYILNCLTKLIAAGLQEDDVFEFSLNGYVGLSTTMQYVQSMQQVITLCLVCAALSLAIGAWFFLSYLRTSVCAIYVTRVAFYALWGVQLLFCLGRGITYLTVCSVLQDAAPVQSYASPEILMPVSTVLDLTEFGYIHSAKSAQCVIQVHESNDQSVGVICSLDLFPKWSEVNVVSVSQKDYLNRSERYQCNPSAVISSLGFGDTDDLQTALGTFRDQAKSFGVCIFCYDPGIVRMYSVIFSVEHSMGYCWCYGQSSWASTGLCCYMAATVYHYLLFPDHSPYYHKSASTCSMQSVHFPPTSLIHDVFHVSQLKAKLGATDASSHSIPPTDTAGIFVIQPLRILQQRSVQNGSKIHKQVLIQWSPGRSGCVLGR